MDVRDRGVGIQREQVNSRNGLFVLSPSRWWPNIWMLCPQSDDGRAKWFHLSVKERSKKKSGEMVCWRESTGLIARLGDVVSSME